MSLEAIQYPFFKPEIVSLAHKDPYTWNIKNFLKMKKFKFYQKISKTGVIKNIDNYHINSRNYAGA